MAGRSDHMRFCAAAVLGAAAVLTALPALTAQNGCQTSITEFREIVNTETSMGHVTQGNQSSALAELARIQQMCSAGRNTEAMQALYALQRRMKFR